MDEAGCSQPRADKYGEQIHQLDGITVQETISKAPRLEGSPGWSRLPRQTAPPLRGAGCLRGKGGNSFLAGGTHGGRHEGHSRACREDNSWATQKGP